MTPYTYILLRKDLTPVQQIVQASHAALEAGFRFKQPEQTSFLIVLEVDDEADLNRSADMLDMRGIEYYKFFEPDDNMGYSALCTRPCLDPDEQNYFNRWELFVPIQT